jgi:hypothetical protein
MTALGSKTVAAGMRRLRQEERKIAVPNRRFAGNRDAGHTRIKFQRGFFINK